MAKQVIGIGTVANDGSGDAIRTAMDKVNDNFTELYDFKIATEADPITAASLFRCKRVVAATGTVGQVIAYSAAFSATALIQIEDYNGLGIEVTAQSANGFTITSLTAGNFGYKSTVEI